MSMLDRQNLFSNEQAITASANSTDVIDLGSSSRDVGAGETNNVLVQVTEAFNNLTSLSVTLQTASTENFTSPIQLTAGTIALASLVAGAKFSIGAVPRGTLRYLRLAYTVTGSAPSTGKITAGMGAEGVYQDTVIYADSL
jgi:succinylarginine dihydrolase